MPTPDPESERSAADRRRIIDTLKNKWVKFAEIVLSPGVVIGTLLAVAAFYGTTRVPQEDSATANALRAVGIGITSLLSAIAGSALYRAWRQANEAGKLVTRGKSAIRGLKLLLLNVNALEKRIDQFIRQLDDGVESEELVRTRYEELVERCQSLQEEVNNSIEEWTDIIPVQEIKTQIGLISSLKQERSKLEGEIGDLQKQLEETREEEKEEKERLREQIAAKEDRARELERELAKTQAELDSSLSSTGLGGLGSLVGSSSAASESGLSSGLLAIDENFKMCFQCGNVYNLKRASESECPECGEDPDEAGPGSITILDSS